MLFYGLELKPARQAITKAFFFIPLVFPKRLGPSSGQGTTTFINLPLHRKTEK